MQRMRSLTAVVRAVLAWYVLTLSVAIASPMVKPQQMDLICSSAGEVKLVMLGDDGPFEPLLPHTLDCPACLPVMLPAGIPWGVFLPPIPPSFQERSFARVVTVALSPSPPPRGPPPFL